MLERTWKSNDEVTLELPMSVTASYWYDGAAVIERGALIYALKLNENWEAKNIDDGSERIRSLPILLGIIACTKGISDQRI